MVHKRHRILVIDDSRTDVSLIKEALTEHGVECDVLVLEDGGKAIKHLSDMQSNARPDLVILDLHLPKNDGLEVLVKYRMSVQMTSVPMIILTSSDSPSERHRAKTLGVSAFIQKPLTLPEFLALGAQFKAVLDSPYIYIGPRS